MLLFQTISQKLTNAFSFQWLFNTTEVPIRSLDRETQKKALENSPFDKLPDELFIKVLERVPADRFVGSLPISRVCHYWYKTIEGEVKKQKPETIVKACKSREDALRILKNQDLCYQLTGGEFFQVISWVKEISKFLLKKNKIHPLDAGLLCEHDVDFARWVIENKVEFEEYRLFTLSGSIKWGFEENDRRAVVALWNLQIATEILAEFREEYLDSGNYKAIELSLLMCSLAVHPELIDEILNTPEYCELLKLDILSDWLPFTAGRQVKLAQYLVANAAQYEQLEPEHLITLMAMHPEIEQSVLASEEMMNDLRTNYADPCSEVQNVRSILEYARKRAKIAGKSLHDLIKPKLDEILAKEQRVANRIRRR